MGWFGTIIGSSIGFFLGGPLGAIGGAALGHMLFDRGGSAATTTQYRGGFGARAEAYQQRQAGYFVALFSLMGKIASADGKITNSERRVVEKFLAQSAVGGQQRQFALQIFEQSASTQYSIAQLCQQFIQLSPHNSSYHLNFMDVLVQIAAADGVVDRRERDSIYEIARHLRVPSASIDQLFVRWNHARHSGDTASYDTADDPYTVLGCTRSSSATEIKQAYRKLAAAYHPDKIIGKDLPEEFTTFATEKFQQIQTAYQRIKAEKGIS